MFSSLSVVSFSVNQPLKCSVSSVSGISEGSCDIFCFEKINKLMTTENEFSVSLS